MCAVTFCLLDKIQAQTIPFFGGHHIGTTILYSKFVVCKEKNWYYGGRVVSSWHNYEALTDFIRLKIDLMEGMRHTQNGNPIFVLSILESSIRWIERRSRSKNDAELSKISLSCLTKQVIKCNKNKQARSNQRKQQQQATTTIKTVR